MVRALHRRAWLAALLVLAAMALAAVPARAATVEYWIAAVNTKWDIAPNGGDPVMGTRIPADQRQFTAVVYRRFTAGWKKPFPNTAESGDNDGIPGPTIRATVGDRVLVHFKNLDRVYKIPHSMHFHAFRYAPSSDGAYIPYVSGRDGRVPFGGTWTYRLTALPSSVGVWPYHDHSVDMTRSIGLGLYGAIVIRAKNEPRPDREFIVYLSEHNGFDTINGRAFIGNTPTFHAKVGDLVQWDVLDIGENFHVFHIPGHRWRDPGGRFVDSELLGPSSTLQVRFREDAPGTWYYHCHVESHQENGMIGLYRVSR